MKFYTFGNTGNPVILLLPGTCCHWKQNFEKAISLLETDFFVVCVSYDGFDETEQTVFPDMAAEEEKIEKYVQENFSGHIGAAYLIWTRAAGCLPNSRHGWLQRFFMACSRKEGCQDGCRSVWIRKIQKRGYI